MRSLLEAVTVLLWHYRLVRVVISGSALLELASLELLVGLALVLAWTAFFDYPFPWIKKVDNRLSGAAALVTLFLGSSPLLFRLAILPSMIIWYALTIASLVKNASAPVPTDDAYYMGHVTHTRLVVQNRSFTYSIFLMLTEIKSDGEAMDRAYDRFAGWTSRGPSESASSFKLSVARFSRSEYKSLSEIQKMVADEGVAEVPARVFLLTHWRYWGIKFNPISYYYCYNTQGELFAILNEVHNTPWGEMTWYLTALPPTIPKDDKEEIVVAPKFTKTMHVSPFMKMHYDYAASFSAPHHRLTVFWNLIDNRKGIQKEERKDFAVIMKLQRVPAVGNSLTQSDLTKSLLRHPFMTLKVVSGIYWQALKLYVTSVPFIDHPKSVPQNDG